MPISEKKLHNAYQHCMVIVQNHYENFPVASRLLNKKLRQPISVVYAFARSADDFADEGDFDAAQRLTMLDHYIQQLQQIEQALKLTSAENNTAFYYESQDPIFTALADVIYKFQLPISLFYDLLSAFKQDVVTLRYETFDDLLDYCRRSANPIGRILLYLNHSASAENLLFSDAICSALQLINFYQDIAQDIDENNRLYLPLEEMSHFKVTIEAIQQHINNKHTHKLLQQQLHRTQQLLESGKPLCSHLKGRFAIEIRMIYSGGQIILNKLLASTDDIYQRPRLQRFDKLKIIWQGLFFKP